jgi:hypothetical protein
VSKRAEETGVWRKFQSVRIFIISRFFYPDIIGIIKSMRMRWIGHVAEIAR